MENDFKNGAPPRPIRAMFVDGELEAERDWPADVTPLGSITGLPGIDKLFVFDEVSWELCRQLLDCRGLPEKRARLRAMLDEMIG